MLRGVKNNAFTQIFMSHAYTEIEHLLNNFKLPKLHKILCSREFIFFRGVKGYAFTQIFMSHAYKNIQITKIIQNLESLSFSESVKRKCLKENLESLSFSESVKKMPKRKS